MMKRLVGFLVFISILLSACGGGKMDISVVEVPKYKDGVSYPFVISVMKNDEGVNNLEIVATLEMARMDHGIIEVVFSEKGEGIYEGEVELPMAGEWIANVVITQDGKVTDETLVFDVDEG